MNEGIEVFLNGGEKEGRKPEKLIRRIDSFLLDYGLAYSGVRNLYIPTEAAGRDHAVFAACDALKKAVQNFRTQGNKIQAVQPAFSSAG